ncbi:hypothetical protein RUM44_007215 [Polyplax serrata]|uniref:Uncharacterized protein n=1 Tax=Polyplax serrata TaxID=468196 RepID=A0ABR1B027_POLSC
MASKNRSSTSGCVTLTIQSLASSSGLVIWMVLPDGKKNHKNQENNDKINEILQSPPRTHVNYPNASINLLGRCDENGTVYKHLFYHFIAESPSLPSSGGSGSPYIEKELQNKGSHIKSTNNL